MTLMIFFLAYDLILFSLFYFTVYVYSPPIYFPLLLPLRLPRFRPVYMLSSLVRVLIIFSLLFR